LIVGFLCVESKVVFLLFKFNTTLIIIVRKHTMNLTSKKFMKKLNIIVNIQMPIIDKKTNH